VKGLRAAPKPQRIESKALTNSANGRACTLRLRGCCDPETVVFAHVRIHSGLGTKPPDFFGVFACRNCHLWQEARMAPHEDVLRAICETQSLMAAEGLLTVKGWTPR
jgi:hypothetical protein